MVITTRTLDRHNRNSGEREISARCFEHENDSLGLKRGLGV